MMRFAFALLALLLAACGQYVRDTVIVEQYVYANGSLPPSENLGFTYEWEDGFHALINIELATGSDPDRLVRVICHELENAQVLRAGDFPDTLAGDWYLWSGDSMPAFSAPVAEEAVWLATLPTMTVRVEGDWLRQPTLEAVNRLNEAAGREVFK